MSDKVKTRAWCFELQLRAESADQSDVATCIHSILHEAHDVTLEFVSFAWSTTQNGQFFDISGFIRTAHAIRAGSLDAWFLDDRITNKVVWTPCTCEIEEQVLQDWTKHRLITEYMTKSSSYSREFLRWDAASSKLVPCEGMPTVSKGGRPPSKKPTEASDHTATVTGDGGSSAPPPADAPRRRRKASRPAAEDGDSSAPPPKSRKANASAAPSAPAPATQWSQQDIMTDLDAIDIMNDLSMNTLRSVWSALCAGPVPRNKEECIAQICSQAHPKTICNAVSKVAEVVAMT